MSCVTWKSLLALIVMARHVRLHALILHAPPDGSSPHHHLPRDQGQTQAVRHVLSDRSVNLVIQFTLQD